MKMTKDLAYYKNLPYVVEVTPPEDADEDWFAEIPLLDGCMTQAPTWAELEANINIAKELWLETALELGMTIPEPQRETA